MKNDKEKKFIRWSMAIVAFAILGIGTFYALNYNNQRIEDRRADKLTDAMGVKKNLHFKN